MKGRAIHYSAVEMAWLEANRMLPIADYQRGFCIAFDRDVAAKNLHALRKRKGWKTGRTGQFEKGLIPFNKGRPCPAGTGGRHPNAERNQFRPGRLPHNTKHLGHERVTKDGYVEISVAETNPHTGYERRYVLKHKHLWEKVHGPVPKGMFLKCLDGNRQNTEPSNWEMLPRAMLPYLQGRYGMDYDAADPEVRPTIMAIAKVKYSARSRSQAVSQ